jgi:hypothetical protein
VRTSCRVRLMRFSITTGANIARKINTCANIDTRIAHSTSIDAAHRRLAYDGDRHESVSGRRIWSARAECFDERIVMRRVPPGFSHQALHVQGPYILRPVHRPETPVTLAAQWRTAGRLPASATRCAQTARGLPVTRPGAASVVLPWPPRPKSPTRHALSAMSHWDNWVSSAWRPEHAGCLGNWVQSTCGRT